MKKVVSIIIILSLLCFLVAGCGRRGSSALRLDSNKTSQKNQIAQDNNTTNLQSDKNNTENNSSTNITGSKNTGSKNTEATSSKMQETSNLMDKLDNSLNGLDNSSDITTAESIINNIN